MVPSHSVQRAEFLWVQGGKGINSHAEPLSYSMTGSCHSHTPSLVRMGQVATEDPPLGSPGLKITPETAFQLGLWGWQGSGC
jgi:hypothetical protein